jgi:hypothetical protein
MTTAVRLGDEYDEALVRRVRAALRAAGATRATHSWGVGGSQEIGQEQWAMEGATITLEAETYEGLTLSGDPQLVQRIVADLSADRS